MNCHATGDGVQTMAGLPPWVLGAALAVALALTLFGLLRGPRWRNGGWSRAWRLELTGWAPLRRLLAKRPFQFALQVPLVAMLGLILWAGFEGSPVAERNLATVLVWTVWWTLLIFDIVLLGRMWCLVCPWEALAAWLRRLAFWRRTDEPLALELPWPRWLRNVYPATVLFVGLTWLELGWGVTMNPRATAILGLAMVLLAVLPALIFERRSFCRFGCLIGRICGIYSLVAPVEVRARDLEVCRTCATKDCLNGNARGYPCPTGQYLGSMQANTYCTVCTECVKTCPSDNVAVNLRAWCSDLADIRKPRRDEAVLALVMLSLTSFHGLTMTPTWNELLGWFTGATGLAWRSAFTVGMGLVLLVPGALFLLASVGATRLGAVPRTGGVAAVATAYAYPLIAVALMYHLAHNAGHFAAEVTAVVPVVSDPLGRGADWFGTASVVPWPLLSQPTVWALMVGFVLLGHWWAVRASERAHRLLRGPAGAAEVPLRARLVVSAFVLAATAANLWLLAQPMEMRTGM